jgi:type II secretory pathway pseudopilin PulG
MTKTKATMRSKQPRQKGYMLLAVMLLITLMLIALSIELPRIAQQIKREKEEELVHRGRDYCTAIKKFYHKNGTYPLSLEQLEDTNHMRFLRKRYKDPITGEADWRLIHVGEAQIAIPTPASPNPTTAPSPTPAPGGSGGPLGPSAGNSQPSGQLGALTTQNIGASIASNSAQPGGGPIIGVASTSKKTSIKEFNGNSEYDQWLFVYDPRLEQIPGGGGCIIASSTSTALPGSGTPPSPSGTPTPSTTTTPNPQIPQ